MLPSPFRPSNPAVEAFLRSLKDVPLSYRDVGMVAAGRIPEGFVEDHNRARIGAGAGDFAKAKAALRDWGMFRVGWTEVWPASAPNDVGTNVAILARAWGMWTLNPARILAAIDERGPIDRFGFTYGSLEGHSESGEEQFTVEWHHSDDSVWYDLHSYSRPGRWFASLAHPITRRVQARFARESLRAMADAVTGASP